MFKRLCRLVRWLVNRYHMPAAPFASLQSFGPPRAESARNRMLRRIAARLREEAR
jgi:hypothetical protein